MSKGLKAIGIRGLLMKQDSSQKSIFRNTLDSILGGFNIKFTAAVTVLALGFGSGLVYGATTEKYDHVENFVPDTVLVQERHNTIFDSYDCTVRIKSPKPGEISVIYDEGCLHKVTRVKLHGVKTEIPYHRLSLRDQGTCANMIKNISYKLKIQTK